MNSSLDNAHQHPARPRLRWLPWLIVASAILMGLPTLRGGFVGGDDHRLVLNHVLVNRPSVDHAIELFRIVHRDLYQPLPLLSFSLEFAIGHRLGFFDRGVEQGAWFFHLNNVLLHALNAWLVFLLIRRLHRRLIGPIEGADQTVEVVAGIAAMLFAIHPVQTEVVAWVNGRMMLLSTLFALLTLISLDRWLGDRDETSPPPARGWADAVLTVFCALLSAISKVRVGLPVLMGIVALTGRQRFGRRFTSVWLLCTAMTAVFAWVNIQATAGADLFSGAAEQLRGPRTVRVILALENYFTHLLIPLGLSNHYPTPPEVFWSDKATIRAIVIVVPVLLLMAWAAWRAPIARLGFVWFFATMVATLPLVPARNILAADRYLYLPIIGLLWPVAAFVWWAVGRWRPASREFKRRVLATGCIALGVFYVAMCWYVGYFYENPVVKTLRVAQLFPDTPRVWERLGWTYHKIGRYDEAAECARRELRHDNPGVRSGAYQLLGYIALDKGESDEAIALLHKALEEDPGNDLGIYRLAMAYDQLNRLEEALGHYEFAAETAPMHNPTLTRLASVYRRLGRRADARRIYLQAVENNHFDITAATGLVELALEDNNPEALRDAEQRLLTLLQRVPDDAGLRINLGVVFMALGRPAEAARQYLDVLADEPYSATAATNLANLVLLGDPAIAEAAGPALDRVSNLSPAVQAAAAYGHFVAGRFEQAAALIDALCARPEAAEARRRLLNTFERFDRHRPDQPLTLCLTTDLLIADGQLDAAKVFLELCARGCRGDAFCQQRASRAGQNLARATTAPAPNAVP